MIIPTDYIELFQTLGAYAYAATTPAELAGELQTMHGTTVDKLFLAIETLYAFREQLDTTGLTLLGQLTGYALANHWQSPGEPTRFDDIHNGVLRDLESASFPDLVDPQPKVVLRVDKQDWRGLIAPNLDQLKLAKRAAVGQILGSKFLAGFTPTTGPVAGATLQTRDVDDRTNWLTSQAAYSAQVSAGNGAILGANFRTADNTTIQCSYQDGLNTLLSMAAWGSSLYGHSWSLKDQINAVAIDTTNPDQDAALKDAIAALDAIDITSGWPA